MFSSNGGKCGVCGDNYADPQPRQNENGGKFGRGIIGAFYKQGENITAGVQITANHIGHFEFSLCKLESPDQVETEECFQTIPLTTGEAGYKVKTREAKLYTVDLSLPKDLTCARCVFRWHWRSGKIKV